MRSNRNSSDGCVDFYCFSGWLAYPCEAGRAVTFVDGYQWHFMVWFGGCYSKLSFRFASFCSGQNVASLGIGFSMN
jgi:hypothetical protein